MRIVDSLCFNLKKINEIWTYLHVCKRYLYEYDNCLRYEPIVLCPLYSLRINLSSSVTTNSGNVLNGPIGKQMVDALVESQQCVEMILKFSDMFLKLRDLTTSQAFQDFDTNKDGWISPKEFQRAMESQKMYSV